MSVEQLSPIAALEAGAQALTGRPVEAWHPQHCGDSYMRILTDGTWLHEGRPIARPELKRLFASILRREADRSYVLVTPGEKLSIIVDDAPFVAVEVASEAAGRGRRLAFRLDTGDVVAAGAANALTLRAGRPYLHVRRGLEARIERAVFYELAVMALADGADGVWSDGSYFALG